MKISQAQLREAAQILYPVEWKQSPGAALVATLKYLNEAAVDFEKRPADGKSKKNEETISKAAEITDLEAHLKANEIHVSAAARALGINAVTLYAWFHGRAKPKPQNLAKIRNFLAKTKAG
jgi:DNA-binding transcriptional regulator YiaG